MKFTRLAEFVICWAIAAVCLLLALGIVFAAPTAELTRNGSVLNRGSGRLFAGLAAVLGEPIARAFFGTLYLALAWLFGWIPIRGKKQR